MSEEVTAVVVTHNSARHLGVLGRALATGSLAPARMLVVDNASVDDSVALGRQASVLETGCNDGFGAGSTRAQARHRPSSCCSVTRTYGPRRARSSDSRRRSRGPRPLRSREPRWVTIFKRADFPGLPRTSPASFPNAYRAECGPSHRTCRSIEARITLLWTTRRSLHPGTSIAALRSSMASMSASFCTARRRISAAVLASVDGRRCWCPLPPSPMKRAHRARASTAPSWLVSYAQSLPVLPQIPHSRIRRAGALCSRHLRDA